MAAAMKLDKLFCLVAAILAGLVGLAFLADLLAGIPFGRFSVAADLIFAAASGLIVWQALETLVSKQ